MTNTDLTNGRWPDLLMQLAGLTPDQLTLIHTSHALYVVVKTVTGLMI